MMKLVIKQVDAFTTTPFGGNPAGVITRADGLQVDDMLRIAGEMNLSETAFVTMPESADTLFRIRFFTPSKEVDLSGHVLIAAAWALAEEGKVPLFDGISTFNFGTNAGTIPVDYHFFGTDSPEDGEDRVVLRTSDICGELHRIMIHQRISRYSTSDLSAGDIASILGIDPAEILGTGLPIEVISTGLRQLMVPVQRKETILDLNPDLIKLGLLNKENGIDTNHIFSMDTFSPQCVTYARHFAPAVGMWEDPGTGTASAGLGNYLMRHGVVTSGSMLMEQGNEIGSLARIIVEVEESVFDEGNVQIGGLAITSIGREISIESGNIVIA
jgi:predicted PhzF superfamily epimerase YddE/YHI9